MFRALKSLSTARWPWLMLAFSALLLEAMGLYFQYVLHYQPCIKCVYVRVAFAALLGIGLLVAIAPQRGYVRLTGIVAWLAAAIYGLIQAHALVNIEQILASGGFTTCALFADFPAWLALDTWLPAVFAVTGTCGGTDWQFAGLSMAEWSRAILLVYVSVAALVLLSQGVRGPYKRAANPYR